MPTQNLSRMAGDSWNTIIARFDIIVFDSECMLMDVNFWLLISDNWYRRKQAHMWNLWYVLLWLHYEGVDHLSDYIGKTNIFFVGSHNLHCLSPHSGIFVWWQVLILVDTSSLVKKVKFLQLSLRLAVIIPGMLGVSTEQKIY